MQLKKLKYIFIGIFVFAFLPQCRKQRSISNPCYAIGTIIYYNEWRLDKFRRSEVDYSFYINGQKYYDYYKNRDGGKKWKIPPFKHFKEGDQFMVQYDLSDPSSHYYDSRMLFDYYVTDSSDYKNYINQFKTNPPQ